MRLALSFIRTLAPARGHLTVGPGISPGLLTPCADLIGTWALAELVRTRCHVAITAGGESHPALRTLLSGTLAGPDAL